MTNKKLEPQSRVESRWPAAGTIFVALLLYALLPSSFPPALRYGVAAVGLALMVPALAINPLSAQGQKSWSRPVAIVLSLVLAIANEVDLVFLLARLLQPASEKEAPILLLAAVQVWVVNIISFAYIFWQLDRGGPVVRAESKRDALPEADFRFPQDENFDAVDEVAVSASRRSGWTANFIDYLYYSLSNAMAFSPPDAVPLTNRMKILTGVEALGAYVLLVLVIARAVSLLG
jgi:branched-subunit amino acid transport protein